ncbi:MAG: nuclear transport factor 2 family protein [Saprospiraceae bacterium]|nr:nuclear transport factor 2 family protein [Saprospiraceae bacterium]
MNIIQLNFEELKKDHWSEQEVKNVKLILDFVQHLMNSHDFDYVGKKFGNQSYTQHNRGIADGMDAIIKYVGDFAKSNPEYTYDVKHVYADGSFVIFQSHATIRAKHRGNDHKGLNIIDIWRVENDQIVEHWDALQPMDGFMRFYNLLAGGKVRNTNGVY